MAYKLPASNLRDSFIAEAQSHLGTRFRAGTLSPFAQRVGYAGHDLPWSGAFIDCVARDTGLLLPACVQTAAGLAEFIRAGRLTEKPRPGDIVFYAWSTVPGFGMPHVGVVTETDRYKSQGIFAAIEAQVSSGLPKASKDRDGVFLRARVRNDVLAFVRPEFKHRPAIGETPETAAKISIRSIKASNKPNLDTEALQRALTLKCDLQGYTPGIFDAKTKLALARWMRSIGFVGADAEGEPELNALERLGRETGLFHVTTE